jgi:hypothetical protein
VKHPRRSTINRARRESLAGRVIDGWTLGPWERVYRQSEACRPYYVGKARWYTRGDVKVFAAFVRRDGTWERGTPSTIADRGSAHSMTRAQRLADEWLRSVLSNRASGIQE